MSWPLRALFGPTLWAIGFCAIYAAHGFGCARGWPGRPAPVGDLHHFTLISLWLICVAAAGVILWCSPRGSDIPDRLIRAGGWIGLMATLLTLFPVLGLTTCGTGP